MGSVGLEPLDARHISKIQFLRFPAQEILRHEELHVASELPRFIRMAEDGRRVDGRRDEYTRFVGDCAYVLGEALLEVIGEEELKILQGES